MEGHLQNRSGQNSESGSFLKRYNEVIYIDLPKKYKKRWTDSFDKRFVIIWVVTFLFHVSLTYYFSTHLPQKEKKLEKIQHIQKQFAQLILKKENVKKSAAKRKNQFLAMNQNQQQGEKGELSSNAAGSAASNNMGKKQGKRTANATQPANNRNIHTSTQTNREVRAAYQIPGNRNYRSPHRESFRIISQNVSDKGLLAFLSSSSPMASGKAVNDILQEADKAHDQFTSTLANVNDLKKGQSEREILQQRENRLQRQSRNTEEADIGNLIEKREKVISSKLNRQGSFEKQTQSAIDQNARQNTGKRDPDDISAVVSKHNSSIQACYQRELRMNPDLKGKVVVRFTISPAGKVIHAEIVSSTLNSERVERCIISRIRRWDDFGEIDESAGNATFRQVYTFGY